MMRYGHRGRHARTHHRGIKALAITGVATVTAALISGTAGADDETLSTYSVDVAPGSAVDVYVGLTAGSTGNDVPGCNVDGSHTATLNVTTSPNSKVSGISPTTLEIAACDDPSTADVFEGSQKVTLTAAADAPVPGSNSVFFDVDSGSSSDPNGVIQSLQVERGQSGQFDTVTTYSAYPGQAVLTVNYVAGASNHAPVITNVGLTEGACSVDVDATFTDADSTDTHTATIDWGAGDGAVAADSVTEPSGADPGHIEGSHTYNANDTYTITVAVSDGDLGDSETASFTAKNTASDLLAPVNKDGSSTFKINSTIPLKITVKNCAGGNDSTLTPAVSLKRIATADGEPVNEDVSSIQPTNGKLMRWDGLTQYIYNLSTKNSQFSPTGGALTAGLYEVTISDDSFFASSVAEFTLRK